MRLSFICVRGLRGQFKTSDRDHFRRVYLLRLELVVGVVRGRQRHHQRPRRVHVPLRTLSRALSFYSKITAT